MRKSDALKLAAYLAAAYRNVDTSAAALAVLADQFVDLEHAIAERAIRSLVAERTFPPTAAEIRAEYFTALHRLPSVAAIVNAIATARQVGSVEDVAYPHPLVREVVLEVGAGKIRDDWQFAHRELGDVAARLRAELLRAVNLGSLTGRAPDLDGRMALVAHGLDPFQRPAVPALPEGWRFHGWSLHVRESLWKGNATGPTGFDFRHFESPLLYAHLDVLALLPGRVGALALPAGSWSPPKLDVFGTTSEGVAQREMERSKARSRAVPPAHAGSSTSSRRSTPNDPPGSAA